MFPVYLAAVDAGADAAKSGLLETFRVDWPYFAAQFINFIIVILVLKKFAFGPIQAMLEQRKNRIAEGEEKLKRIEEQLADSEKATQAAIDKANALLKRKLKRPLVQLKISWLKLRRQQKLSKMLCVQSLSRSLAV